MKKAQNLIGVVILVILCIVVISSSIMAATGLKIEKKTTVTQNTAEGGNVYYGTINIAYNPNYFNGQQPYYVQTAYTLGNGLYISQYVLDYLQTVAPTNAAVSALLSSLGSVGTELATTGAAGVSQGSDETEYQQLGSELKGSSESTNNAIANSYAVGERGATYTNSDPKTLYVATDVSAETATSKVGNKIVKTTNVTITGITYDFYTFTSSKYVSPLVLDMVGNGKLEASKGNHYPHTTFTYDNAMLVDFNNNGFEVAMEWVGPNDGLLVAPKADGTIDVTCLFGTNGGFDNGFEKLSLYDTNNDKKVSGNELDSLSVWQDKNQNGSADQGELTTCRDAGITSINVRQANYMSSFVRNGKTYKMWDWWPTAMELRKVAKK